MEWLPFWSESFIQESGLKSSPYLDHTILMEGGRQLWRNGAIALKNMCSDKACGTYAHVVSAKACCMTKPNVNGKYCKSYSNGMSIQQGCAIFLPKGSE